MDWSLLHALNDFMAAHDGLEDSLLFYVEASEALFVATLAVVFLCAHGVKRLAWRQATVAAVLSAGLALAIAKVISELVDRARPFVADPHGVHLFSAHAPDPGFPSDHATAAFAIAVAILLRKRGWGIFALAAATVLAVGRVALGVHYPSDVLAGAAVGVASALVLWWAPLRARTDALADTLGRRLDRLLDGGADRLGLRWRA
ncbi:MAG TPA: phosphatase PAP2 family protein [Solirubrobacterales bacterium]|jgi:undecaprenyl-diphosphatase|nr:phosphatase PAP2 family protein [Solirubrobacterales bacterium]